MDVILSVVQIIASIALVGLILMQQGKGADAGASFGAGASQTFFGSSGSGNAITKMTVFFASVFFIASLWLAYLAKQETVGNFDLDLSTDIIDESIAPQAGQSDQLNQSIAPASQTESNEETLEVEASNLESSTDKEATEAEEAQPPTDASEKNNTSEESEISDEASKTQE